MPAERRPDGFLQEFGGRSRAVLAKRGDVLAGEVGGHQDQGIAEIDLAPFAIVATPLSKIW